MLPSVNAGGGLTQRNCRGQRVGGGFGALGWRAGGGGAAFCILSGLGRASPATAAGYAPGSCYPGRALTLQPSLVAARGASFSQQNQQTREHYIRMRSWSASLSAITKTLMQREMKKLDMQERL